MKFNIKAFLNYIIVILVTSLGITSILIALPLTEKVSERTPFNLQTKDSLYWSKEYVLNLDTEDNREIQESRDIIYKRLKKFDLEDFSITQDGSKLYITVQTTKSKDLVSELIKNRFFIQIVTQKDDVDFADEENQYAYLFPTSYNETDWDREDFRNVYITELKTTDNSYAYFAIFKTRFNNGTDFTNFLKENIGKYVGVNIDGFVTPYQVPFDDQSIFAIPITATEDEQIKTLDILYNTGIVPTAYTVESETDIDPQIMNIDHIKVSIGLITSIVLTYAYLLFMKQDTFANLREGFLASILTTSIYLTILKIFQIPVDTFLLPLLIVPIFVLIKVFRENPNSILIIFLIISPILLLTMIFGTGYMQILATHLLSLSFLAQVCLVLSKWYISKVNSI